MHRLGHPHHGPHPGGTYDGISTIIQLKSHQSSILLSAPIVKGFLMSNKIGETIRVKPLETLGLDVDGDKRKIEI